MHVGLVALEVAPLAVSLQLKASFLRKFFPPGTYVVSIDDDVERISWKIREGMTHHVLRSLPPGSLAA